MPFKKKYPGTLVRNWLDEDEILMSWKLLIHLTLIHPPAFLLNNIMSNKCKVCTKTVYPMEAIAFKDLTYHKLCFKCMLLWFKLNVTLGSKLKKNYNFLLSGQECGFKLNLKTANGVGENLYCAKHTPVNKPTATTVDGSLSLSNAKSK